MYIKTNDHFKKILGKGYLEKIKEVTPCFSKKIAQATIKEVGGCYYLDFMAPKKAYNPPLVDKVGEESSENKIVIEYFISSKLSNKLYLLQAGKYALELAEKLSKLAPKKFKIIVSFQKVREYFPKVTFHKIRKGEIYLTRNLNDYKINGLMVIYT